ncbi:MAG: 16S rRNA (cytidine(1402)-2'-O)-methyltransferase [SAR202 cluster bacterium]|nr:16S rRNA (cytidine(1402)-2'-O)-methyltransferase [SAR202 cluster bacterium]
MGTLYVVATPIGNLEDLTFRAVNVLRSVGLIAAEDTRTARKLLGRYGLATPVTSYHARNARGKLQAVLAALAEHDVALISEAGTPGLSDPGSELAAEAARCGFPVVTVPGPSAVTAALAVAGLPVQRFLFLGFLPAKSGERRRALQGVAALPFALVLLEAPHRVRETLRDMLDCLGDRRVVVCRELTKVHEEVFRGTVGTALEHFTVPRGEFTLVVEGAVEGSQRPGENAAPDPRALLSRLRTQGASARDAVAEAARATGVRRKKLYRMWLEGANER